MPPGAMYMMVRFYFETSYATRCYVYDGKILPQSFYNEILSLMQSNAQLFHNRILAIPGLKPVMQQGAMYMMVSFYLSLSMTRHYHL